MGFINSLGQVISNQKQFKDWEKDDANKKEQRSVLAQKNLLSQEELNKAKNKGKVIMDVVDIMDTHSEEVAENVETAVIPINEIAPLLGFFGSTLGVSKFVFNPAEKANWDAISNFNKSDKGQELKEIARELAEKAKKADIKDDISKLKLHEWSDGADLFKKKNLKILSESKDERVKELYKKVSQYFDDYKKIPAIKNYGKKIGMGFGIIGAVTAGLFVGMNLIAAKLQVKSSRIARWQSRQDLENPKYFVQYTDEQRKIAEQNLENSKKEEKPTLFGNKFKGMRSEKPSFFKTLTGIVKDNKKYNEWKKTNNLEDKKVNRQLTQEELKDAQKDQEVIQRITKEINNNAEEYSENMEVAAGVLIGGTPFLGAGIGSIINLIVNKTGLGEKFSTAAFNKAIKDVKPEKAEELKKLFEELKPAIDKNGKKIKPNMGKALNFAKEMWENVDTKVGASGNKFADIFAMGKKGLKIALTTTPMRNTLVGLVGAITTGVVGAFLGLKLQKASARAGRFKAKQEIEQNQMNFIGYTKEDFESVKDVKAKKETLGEKFKNYITFLPRVIKDYFDYEKYRKTEAKKEKELLNELIKLDVSEEQLKEAKDLQRKVFTTFESVDDKSQEYSESIEAVNEMVSPVLPYAGIAIASIPVVIGGIKLFKGGVPNAAEKITKFLSKHTNFLKGKAVSNYVDDVGANLSKTVQKQHSYWMPEEQKEMVHMLANLLPDDVKDLKGVISATGLSSKQIKQALDNGTWRDMLSGISKNMPDNGLKSTLEAILKSNITDKQARNIFDNLEVVTKNIPSEQLEKLLNTALKEFHNNPEKFLQALNKNGLKDIFVTKGIAKAGAIASGTWAALSLVLTFALESMFASMQKQAGRLGVMKGLEELQDEKFYANSEPSPTFTNKPAVVPNGYSQMLQNYINKTK